MPNINVVDNETGNKYKIIFKKMVNEMTIASCLLLLFNILPNCLYLEINPENSLYFRVSSKEK